MAGAAAALASMGLAACGASHTSQPLASTTIPQSSTSTTVSIAAAGAAYLAAVAPANAAISAFSAAAGRWTSSTTNAQAEADAQPAISALQALGTTLTNDQWPASATNDVHTLVGDDAAVVGDLQGLASVNLLDTSSFIATLKRDLSSTASAVALVRHDLDLPAAVPAG